MIKTKLSDYKTKKVTIFADEKELEIEIRSMASREFKDATAEYVEIINHAKKNKIDLETTVEVDHGLGVTTAKTVLSEYSRKALAILLSSLIVDWPLESDLKQDLIDNEDFANLVDVAASELKEEFISKKKT